MQHKRAQTQTLELHLVRTPQNTELILFRVELNSIEPIDLNVELNVL